MKVADNVKKKIAPIIIVVFVIITAVLLVILYNIKYSTNNNVIYARSYKSAKVELGDYKNIAYEYEYIKSTEEEIEESILKSFETRDEIKEGIANYGDTVSISYSAYKNNMEIESAKTEDIVLTIGDGYFTEPFEEGLVGNPIGHSFKFEIAFDNDEEIIEEFRESTIEFDVSINYKLGELYIPELTDEFIADNTNSEYNTYKDYYNSVKEYFEFINEDVNKYNIKSIIQEKLMDNTNVTNLNQSELDNYMGDVLLQYTLAASNLGINLEEYAKTYMELPTMEDLDAKIREDANNYFKLSITLLKIAKKEGIRLSDKEYEEFLVTLATYYGYNNIEEIKEIIKDNNDELLIRHGALQEKVLDYLMEISKNNLE